MRKIRIIFHIRWVCTCLPQITDLRGKAKPAMFNGFVFPIKCPNIFTPPSSHLIGNIGVNFNLTTNFTLWPLDGLHAWHPWNRMIWLKVFKHWRNQKQRCLFSFEYYWTKWHSDSLWWMEAQCQGWWVTVGRKDVAQHHTKFVLLSNRVSFSKAWSYFLVPSHPREDSHLCSWHFQNKETHRKNIQTSRVKLTAQFGLEWDRPLKPQYTHLHRSLGLHFE